MDPRIKFVGTPEEADETPAMVDMLTSKRCGECNLCCTAMEVFELNKPIGERCTHLNECGKCSIYATRPTSCKVFYCTWRLQEILSVKLPWDLKPDKCGFVLHWDRGNSPLCTLFPDPKRPKAWLQHKRWLEKFARTYDCAIVIGGGAQCTHMVTPMGRWISRADYPLYFRDGEIGIPRSEFRNVQKQATDVDPYEEQTHGSGAGSGNGLPHSRA